MKRGAYLDTLLRSPKTVFSTKEIALLWRESSSRNRARLHYATANGQLIRLRRGLYAKDKNYNPHELAVKLMTPAYVSFETVLLKAGVIFQYDESIYVASYLSRTTACGPYQFVLRRIKESILTNPQGIDLDGHYAVASTERAFLDTLYLHKGRYFDNLSVINWEKAFALLPIYGNQRLQREVEALHRQDMEDNDA